MSEYIAGWDGGGTKTMCEVRPLGSTPGLNIIRFHAGPLNPNGGVEGQTEDAAAALLSRMSALPGGLEGCRMLCIAVAGISNPNAVVRLRTALDRAGYRGEVLFTGDQRAALYGALGGPGGAVLIAGTGSICYGQAEDGREARTGGWGNLMDDEGGGYALGRDMLAAVVRAEDGRAGATVLRELVFQALSVSDLPSLMGAVYAPGTGKREIAALAPLLNGALIRGDAAAERIRDKAATELALLVGPVAAQLDLGSGRLALMGSVLEKCSPIRAKVVHLLAERYPGLCCQQPERDAAAGAVLLALWAWNGAKK